MSLYYCHECDNYFCHDLVTCHYDPFRMFELVCDECLMDLCDKHNVDIDEALDATSFEDMLKLF